MTIALPVLPDAQGVYVARGGPSGHLWRAMPSDTIGSRLRHYRRAKHWSQRRLAEESGVTRQTIAEMERDAVTIPREPANVRALAKALGISMRELAEPTGWYEDERHGGTPLEDVLAWVRSERRVDDSGRAAIEHLIRREVEAYERRESGGEEPTPDR